MNDFLIEIKTLFKIILFSISGYCKILKVDPICKKKKKVCQFLEKLK